MNDVILQLLYSGALQAQKLRKNEKVVERLPWRWAVGEIRKHLVNIGAWQ